MKRRRLILFAGLAALLCGVAFQPLYAFEPKPMLREADTLYSKGDRPEKALELYAQVIADGSDKVCTILAKLKTGYIYEEQLMQYDKALEAYDRFTTDYPDSRLTKIVKNKVKRITALKTLGELEDYKEFKVLEKKYLTSSRRGNEVDNKKARKDAVFVLYAFAKEHCTQSYNDELIPRVLNTLAQEQCFLEAYLLIRLVEKEVPEAADKNAFSYDSVEHRIHKAAIVFFSKVMIGLCLLFVLTGRGFKRSWLMVKGAWIRLLVFSFILFAYMGGYHIYVRIDIPDAGMDNDWLFYILTEIAILIPFSILLFNSFPYIKEGWMKKIFVWILCVLLGASTWALFAHEFNFLLETRM